MVAHSEKLVDRVGFLATYPKRSHLLQAVVERIAPQLTRLFVCLNEYEVVPGFFDLMQNVTASIPDSDMKDVGKFYIPAGADLELNDDTVFLYFDDDIDYPPEYAEVTSSKLARLGRGNVVGYHGSTYLYPALRPSREEFTNWIKWKLERIDPMLRRKIYHFGSSLNTVHRVEQLGTGVLAAYATDVPPLEYMLGSQQFVDVRFARWCWEKGIQLHCLDKEKDWLTGSPQPDSIYETFTKSSPESVKKEILTFAFGLKVRW